MAKKDFSNALDSSLEAEVKAVDARFQRAEAYYSEKDSVESNSSIDKHATKSPPRAKAVRDIFTMPPEDHALIDELKVACMRSGLETNKSLVIRAGLHALNAMDKADLFELVSSLERLKPGRRSA